jgi:hypothetical protein
MIFRTVTLFTSLCSLLIVLACDDFAGANVREEIDNAAWDAKAPRITVLPNVRDGTGVVAPSNTSFIVKQHITMEVSYNLTNTDYSFVGWQAYEGDVRQNYDWDALSVNGVSPLPPEKVLIQMDGERPTNAKITVRLGGGTITLVPVVTSRPRVVNFDPKDGGVERPAILNSPVVIQFSSPMNLASLSWGMNANGTPVWAKQNAEGKWKFKNITFTGRGTFGRGTPFDFEEYYYDEDNPPYIDSTNTILTFPANQKAMQRDKPYFIYVYVDIDASIQAVNGVSMGTPGHYQYFIDNKWDTTGPVVTLVVPYRKMNGGEYKPIPQDEDTGIYLARISDEDKPLYETEEKIHLVVAAYDSIDEGDLSAMIIGEAEKAANSYDTENVNKDLHIVNRYNTGGEYAALQAQVEAAYGNLPGVFFVIPYSLNTGSGGTAELIVYCFDQSGNPSLVRTEKTSGDTTTVSFSNDDMYRSSSVTLTRQ